MMRLAALLELLTKGMVVEVEVTVESVVEAVVEEDE